VRVYVNDPNRLEELRDALLDVRCFSVRVGVDLLDVTHPSALDEREALIELTFFLRVWEADRPGTQVELVA
jgi:hypothetical protein